jgi:hypothetical protein
MTMQRIENEPSSNKIKFEILRLITPIMISVLGTLMLMQVSRVEATLTKTSDNMMTLTGDVSEMRANIQSIEQRLIRDETIYDKRGFK